MNYEEFNKKFHTHVNNIPYEKQFELAISICKKLFSDYKDFYQETQWGNPDVLLDAIRLCELYYNSNEDINALEEMLLKVDNITPDTDDFEIASYALNACTAAYDTLQFLINKDSKYIISVASYLTDTINFKIQENDVMTEQQINKHPLMIEARRFLLEF